MNLVYNLTLVTLTSFVDQEMGLKFHSSVFQPPVCHSCQIYTRAFQTGSSSSQHGLTHGHLEPGLENKQASMHQNVIPVNKQHTKKFIGCQTTSTRMTWISSFNLWSLAQIQHTLYHPFRSYNELKRWFWLVQSWWQWISATVVRTFIPMAGPLGKLSSFTAILNTKWETLLDCNTTSNIWGLVMKQTLWWH